MQKVNVGLIGFGLSGRHFHLPFLQSIKGYDVVAISSSRTEEIRSLAPQAKVVKDPLQLIQDQSVDLVVNCGPNTVHYSYSAAALEHGKHVVVEKPFVTSIAEGERLIELSKKTKRVLSVFHNRRWDSDFLTVTQLLKSGQLGDIKQFESRMDRWRPNPRPERWREQAQPGSGLFYDLGPHLIDQAVILFGTPDKVQADIQCQRPGALTDDYFHVTFFYDELRVILQSSSFTNTTPRFHIFGSKASFLKFGLDPQETQLKAGVLPLDPKFGWEEPSIKGRLLFPERSEDLAIPSQKGSYISFYENLYKALVGERDFAPVPAEEALQTMRLLELCRRSSDAGAVLNCP